MKDLLIILTKIINQNKMKKSKEEIELCGEKTGEVKYKYSTLEDYLNSKP